MLDNSRRAAFQEYVQNGVGASQASRLCRLLHDSDILLPRYQYSDSVGENLPVTQVDWNVAFWCVRYYLFETLYVFSGDLIAWCKKPTIFSKTHLFSNLSGRRHCHNWWLWLSRQFQCLLNDSRQCSLMSFSLKLSEHGLMRWKTCHTH